MISEPRHFPRPSLGYAPLSGWSLLKATGNDRLSFLSGITTNSVKSLQMGQGNRSLLLTTKGRIVSEILILHRGDELELWVPEAQFSTVHQTLEKYLILEDVILTPADKDPTPCLLAGSELPSWLEKQGLAFPETGDSITLSGAPQPAPLGVRLPLWGDLPLLFLSPGEQEPLASWLQSEGVPPLDPEVVLAGGLIGSWLDTQQELRDVLVHEAELEQSHVDFKKGCFLGQEVVARTHYRGRARKSPAVFQLSSKPPANAAAQFVLGADKQVGEIKRALSIQGDWYARGLLKDSALEQEEALTVRVEERKDRIDATLVEWSWA